MAVPTLIELAESGAHFGHHRSMTYPKARSFVFMVKSNVALINLEQTQSAIAQAQKTISEYRENGKTILFVGTKRSVRQFVQTAAASIGACFITERWFGGTLTNFSTIQANIKRMNELEELLASDKGKRMSKIERLRSTSRLARYHRFLGGLAGLKSVPDLIIVASASEDSIAIREANQLGIPVIAITDTDINPEFITFPIPANDDAPKAVELIINSIVMAPEAPKTKSSEKPAKAVEKEEDESILVKEDKPESKKIAKVSSKKAVKPKAETAKKPVKKTVTKKSK